MALPTEGTRINHAGQLGTVKYVGNVDNTTGIWLGIEWDVPQRGKHDGVKDNKRYFTCRIHNAGSFIRPSANISYGRSFVDALVSKYIEAPHGSESQEKVLLGSSNGAIVVEAVRLDKIRVKLANLGRLREVSLDNENVAKADPPATIQNTCPSIRDLDLSFSLLPSWDVVAAIAVELPALQRLALNRNRLQTPKNPSVMGTAFLALIELQLNGTMSTWQEMRDATALMPNLRHVEMGYNRLNNLSNPDCLVDNSTVQVINLDSNLCSDWINIFKSLNKHTFLQRVILTSNCIDAIPFPEHAQQRSHSLRHISLSFNRLKSWSDIDALSSWCPGIETLTLSGNPLVGDHKSRRHSRPFTISRIPSLLALDGASISPKERTDSEIFYLSYVMQFGPESEDVKSQAHPQWLNLCKKHGKPDNAPKGKAPQDKLRNHLIEINLYQIFQTPESNDPNEVNALLESSKSYPLRVLPTMSMRTVQMKLCKAMKLKQATVAFWLRMDDGKLVDLQAEGQVHDLDWLGLRDGSNVIFLVRKEPPQ